MTQKINYRYILMIAVCAFIPVASVSGQNFQFDEDDQKRICRDLDEFIAEFTNSLCLCNDIKTGRVEENSDYATGFGSLFADSNKIIGNLFFDSIIVPQAWFSPQDYKKFAITAYRNIRIETSKEPFYLLNTSSLQTQSSLRMTYNDVFFSKKQRKYLLTFLYHIKKFEGQYVNEDYIMIDTNEIKCPESNFINRMDLKITICFEVDKQRIKGTWKNKKKVRDGSPKIIKIEKAEISQVIADEKDKIREQLKFIMSDDDSTRIKKVSYRFLNRFNNNLLLRNDRDNAVDDSLGVELIQLFKEPECLSIEKKLFFPQDSGKVSPEHFVEMFTSRYKYNYSTLNRRDDDNFKLHKIEIVNNKIMKLYYEINYLKQNYKSSIDSLPDNIKDSAAIKLVAEARYSWVKDEGEWKILLDEDNIRVIQVADSFDDVVLRIKRNDSFVAGAYVSYGFPFMASDVNHSSGYSDFCSNSGSCLSLNVFMDYYPDETKGKANIGFGAGIGYSRTVLYAQCDSLIRTCPDSNILGSYKHIVKGKELEQKSEYATLSVPVYCKLKKNISAKSYFTLSLGLSFDFQMSMKLSATDGSINHSGQYEFELPDGTIVPTLIENVPEYQFTQYPVQIRDYESDLYKNMTLNGMFAADLNYKISSSRPLFLKVGAVFKYGITDLFTSHELNTPSDYLIDQGNIDSMFNLNSNHKVSIIGLNIGLSFLLK